MNYLNVCQFKMDELAQIVAAIPGVEGSVTIPYKKKRIIEDEEEAIFYYPCKGKRSLLQGKDDKKIEKYILEFDKLVEKLSGRNI